MTDKIYILAESRKLKTAASQVIRIKGDNHKVVRSINKDIYKQAYKTVGTSDEKQLIKIIEDIKNEI